MKIPHSPRTTGLRFDMTPLIDVVFLLIIFFLVASQFVRYEASDPVELPVAVRVSEKAAPSIHQLVLTVTRDGRYQIEGVDLDLDEVEQQILSARQVASQSDEKKKFEVLIRGDRTVSFSVPREILTICARSRVPVVSFAVLPSSK